MTGHEGRWWPRINRRALGVALLTLGLGLLLFFRGHGLLRGFGADVLVVMHLVADLAAVGLGRPRLRLIAVGLLSVGLEALQGLHLVGKEAPWLLHLLLGSTYDPLDMLAYAIGLLCAFGLERWWAIPSVPSTAG